MGCLSARAHCVQCPKEQFCNVWTQQSADVVQVSPAPWQHLLAESLRLLQHSRASVTTVLGGLQHLRL